MRYTKQSKVIKDHEYTQADFSTSEDNYLKKKFARIIAEQKAQQKAAQEAERQAAEKAGKGVLRLRRQA